MKAASTSIHAKSNKDKICMSYDGEDKNVYNLEGSYKLQYYSEDIKAAIYHNEERNLYMREYTKASGYFEYYINDYETNEINIAKCIGNVTITTDCIGQWEIMQVSGELKTVCDDICINGNVDRPFLNGIYVWSDYNALHKSNMYFCKACETYRNIAFLFKRKIQSKNITNDPYYTLNVGKDFKQIWRGCLLGTVAQLGDNYVFDSSSINDCKFWFSFDSHLSGELNVIKIGDINIYPEFVVDAFTTLVEEFWKVDENSTTTLCSVTINNDHIITSDTQLNALPSVITQDNKICISNSSNASATLLNGEYTWLYYNSKINGSTYYNMETENYIYPYVSNKGEYRYYIHNHEINGN